jgi:hypothetical protein
MTGVYITFAIGILILIFDYRHETRPDEKDKHQRPRKLSTQAKANLRQLFFGTFIAAAAVYFIQQMFD